MLAGSLMVRCAGIKKTMRTPMNNAKVIIRLWSSKAKTILRIRRKSLSSKDLGQTRKIDVSVLVDDIHVVVNDIV